MNNFSNITEHHLDNAAHTSAQTCSIDAARGSKDYMVYVTAFKDGGNWIIDQISEVDLQGNPLTPAAIIKLCNMTGSALSFAHEVTLKATLPQMVTKFKEGQERWGKFAATKLKETERCTKLLQQILRAGVSPEVANEINTYLSELSPVTDEEKKDLPDAILPEPGAEA